MDKSEYNVITFLRKHGQEIVERESYKYEPIKKEVKNIEYQDNTEKEEINKDLKIIKEEIRKLKADEENEEWYNKYKKI